MTPKIRGVAPAMRRYTRPDLGVKKVEKGHKELDPEVNRLPKGDVVEVRLQEEGLHGSWHPAVICGVKRGLRQVQFKTLLDDKKNPVKEWVRFGKEALGTKLPPGTRKVTDNKPVLRPGGPGLPPPKPSFRKTGGWPKDLWVEVYSEEAWWEGVLVEDISAAQMSEDDSVVDVIFPHLSDLIEQVTLKNLRECKDWNEETGLWTIRGRRSKEDDLVPAIPGSPEFEQEAVKHRGGEVGTGQDEGSCFVEIEDVDRIGDIGVESVLAAAQVPCPSNGPVRTVQSNTGLDKAFGQLTDVVENEGHFLLKVHTSGYTMEQMQISVKQPFLSLEVTAKSSEEKLSTFTCKVYSVCSAILGLPTNIAIDHENIRWELEGEVLTVTVPRAGKGGEN